MANASEFLDADGKWQCTMCGACCLLGPLLFPENALMRTFDRGDGGCKHLNSRMKCRIYENRPDICRPKVNSPDATDMEMATACAGLKTIMDREIATGKRSPQAKKWRTNPTCQ